MTDHRARLLRQLEVELPSAVRLRHQIHMNPRLSGEEMSTLLTVLAALPGEATPSAGTGALIRVGGAGPAVAIRAELDALSVTENSGRPWASRCPGIMHACGHDVHIAALVALTRAVAGVGGPAPLLAVFQPREEAYPSGARDIMESGAMQAESVQAVIAAHLQPTLPAGTVACTPGPVNASSDEIAIVVEGRGGHAAYPHLTQDPVSALAHVIVAAQSLVSRKTDPLSAVVLTITTLEAGSSANVTPDSATARGTVRVLDTAGRATVLENLNQVVELVACAHGCRGRLEITSGEPVLENSAALAAATSPILEQLGLSVEDNLRSAGSDDFSFYSARIQALMMFVGVDAEGGGLHSSDFAPSDDEVGNVARVLLAGYLAAASLMPPSEQENTTELFESVSS